jgi:5-hydroxyisourate hydrolase
MMRPVAGLSLSLHVLDTARGHAAAALTFTLGRVVEADRRIVLAEGTTDGAGRWALHPATPLDPGIHEFVFAAEAYQARFDARGFYDLIVIRFRLEQDGGHHHIPLILSPFGYSTYRGG